MVEERPGFFGVFWGCWPQTLSPLNSPSLQRDERELRFFCNWCVSLADYFSNLHCKRRAKRKSFTHWEMSKEELEINCCSIPHGDIQVREAFCLTSTLKCHLPSPQLLTHLCTDCTRGSGWEVHLCKTPERLVKPDGNLHKGGKNLLSKPWNLVMVWWPWTISCLPSPLDLWLPCPTGSQRWLSIHCSARTINLLHTWITLFPNWLLLREAMRVILQF